MVIIYSSGLQRLFLFAKEAASRGLLSPLPPVLYNKGRQQKSSFFIQKSRYSAKGVCAARTPAWRRPLPPDAAPGFAPNLFCIIVAMHSNIT
jgi:hypothetical protein